MSDTWTAVVSAFRLDLLAYLILAIILGGAVGIERELKGKPAGLRTNVLICVGAALFTQLSIMIAGEVGDPARIAAQIVTGVGFLGAGTIIQSRGGIVGLTSAATIWLVAAIGVTVGYGAILEAVGATVLVVLVLTALGKFEDFLTSRTLVSHLSVETDSDPRRLEEIEQLLAELGLMVDELTMEMRGDRMIVAVEVRGPKALHEKAKVELLRKAGTQRLSVWG